MKNWQFIILLSLIILGFWIVIYQNSKSYRYLEILEDRQIEIYKDTWQTDSIKNDLNQIKRSI